MIWAKSLKFWVETFDLGKDSDIVFNDYFRVEKIIIFRQICLKLKTMSLEDTMNNKWKQDPGHRVVKTTKWKKSQQTKQSRLNKEKHWWKASTNTTKQSNGQNKMIPA